jgi:asparagine synthase (glutamine-hydrolysing)
MDALEELLPEGLVDRPKEGFVMPINDWLLESLGPFVMDTLSASRLARHGLLEPIAIRRLLDRYYAGEKTLASRIWNLVSFQVWWDRYVLK